MSEKHIDTLERGQCALDDLISIEKAHDVRTLRGCAFCGGLGHSYAMIEGSAFETRATPWYHGRCFAKAFGDDQLMKLGRLHLEKLPIGDLGTRLMSLLIDRLNGKTSGEKT